MSLNGILQPGTCARCRYVEETYTNIVVLITGFKEYQNASFSVYRVFYPSLTGNRIRCNWVPVNDVVKVCDKLELANFAVRLQKASERDPSFTESLGDFNA